MSWLGARRERRLAALEEFRQARRLVDEDVTVFGEELADLHGEMLAVPLDQDTRQDYQRALDVYDEAKSVLAAAVAAEDATGIVAVEKLLDDGRWRLACVLARRDDRDLPARRESCFFNPQHGPAVEDLMWTPPHGTEREIGVCRSDARRITGGEDPEVRLVRVGDRYVPWYAARAERGLLVSTLGTRAVAGVPKHVMLEADINRASRNTPGGSGRL
jgi:hypothetical protein